LASEFEDDVIYDKIKVKNQLEGTEQNVINQVEKKQHQ
jgi:hypothetical protein